MEPREQSGLSEYCPDHKVCVYQLKELQDWKAIMETRWQRLQALLIANLAAVIVAIISIWARGIM